MGFRRRRQRRPGRRRSTSTTSPATIWSSSRSPTIPAPCAAAPATACRSSVNAAPIADAGPDLVGAPGQELTFAAAGSLDPDGDVAEYLWEFKDGAERERRRRSATLRAARHLPACASAVRDDTGQDKAVDYDEAKVVINAPPVARAGPDSCAGAGRRGDLRCRQLVRSATADRDLSLGLQRPDRADLRPAGGPRLRRARRLHRAADRDRRQRRDQRASTRTRSRSASTTRRSPTAGRDIVTGRQHGHVRRLRLGRRRRRCR